MATPATPQTLPPLTVPTLPIPTLREFLDEIKSLFDNIVYYWDQLLIKRNFRQWLRGAWDELRSQLDAVRDSINWPTFAEKVRDVGLDGPQLRLKLEALNDVWSRFHERGLVSLLRNVLEWINVCLDSLTKVFPQLEAVREFIDAVSRFINQNESLTGQEAPFPGTAFNLDVDKIQ